MDMPSFPPWRYSNGVFLPCPTCPRTCGIDVKKALVLVPVINMHPLLDIGDALYKSVGCMRGNTVTKMGRI